MRCFRNAFFIFGGNFMNNEYEDAKKEFYKKLDNLIENYMEAAAFADNFLKYYNEKYGEESPEIKDDES